MSSRYQNKVLAALGALVGHVSARDKQAMQGRVSLSTNLGSRLKGFMATLLSFLGGRDHRTRIAAYKYPNGYNKAQECERRQVQRAVQVSNAFCGDALVSNESAQERWDRTWLR